MEMILDELLSKFPEGNASEADLLEFAKQAGVDEKELDDIQNGFSIIDKTTERVKRLALVREAGGTLASFVKEELNDVSKNLEAEEKAVVFDAFKKAAEKALNNSLEEE